MRRLFVARAPGLTNKQKVNIRNTARILIYYYYYYYYYFVIVNELINRIQSQN